MWFFGSMMALYMIYLMIKWGLIVGAVIIGLWLVVAILKGIANGWNGYADKDTYSTSTYYKPDPTPAVKKLDSYNIEEDYSIPPKPTSISNTRLDHKPTPKPATKSDSNKVYTLVGVRFRDGGKIYEYLADNPDVRVGDTVYVDTRGGDKELKVETVKKSTEANLELPLKRYKTAYSSVDKIYNEDHLIISGQITVERMGEYTDDTDLSVDEDYKTSDEVLLNQGFTEEDIYHMAEAYICPECGSEYDGIECGTCGHVCTEPGKEEIDEDQEWFDGMIDVAMFDAEDRRNKSEGLFGDYGDEFDEEDEW